MRVVTLITIFWTFSCNADIVVLILARGGSEGIPLKNLQTVGGLSLIARSILSAKKAGFMNVTVSTDHPLIASEAIKFGASVFCRSSITASNFAPSIWGVAEFLTSAPLAKIIVLIQATSPFIRVSDLQDAIRKLQYPKPHDCVFSVSRSYKLRWQFVNGTLFPMNFNYDKRPRRQDWNGELIENGAFYISRVELIKKGYLQNNNCTVQEVSSADSLEVDSYYDLQKQLTSTMTNSPEVVTFEDLEATDVISVELVPERKGLILKHCEYYVSSRRHGTTVTRRYNEFVQLCDVLCAKYPYRAICRLPPKRVVVGGGSPLFLQRRRAALQRWLTLVARHPVLAHDADLRTFLCESSPRLEKPKHDEFVLAGTQDDSSSQMSMDEMQAAFASDQEQLRLLQLGLSRLFKIFERVEGRCEAEHSDIRELGAALSALGGVAPGGCPRWLRLRDSLKSAAELATAMGESSIEEVDYEDGAGGRVLLALDALGAYRELCARLTRGLHGERAAAAAAAPHSPAAQLLRRRHRYSLACSIEESRVARAYSLAALQWLPELLRTHGAAHARTAALWADLHAALEHAPAARNK